MIAICFVDTNALALALLPDTERADEVESLYNTLLTPHHVGIGTLEDSWVRIS